MKNFSRLKVSKLIIYIFSLFFLLNKGVSQNCHVGEFYIDPLSYSASSLSSEAISNINNYLNLLKNTYNIKINVLFSSDDCNLLKNENNVYTGPNVNGSNIWYKAGEVDRTIRITSSFKYYFQIGNDTSARPTVIWADRPYSVERYYDIKKVIENYRGNSAPLMPNLSEKDNEVKLNDISFIYNNAESFGSKSNSIKQNRLKLKSLYCSEVIVYNPYLHVKFLKDESPQGLINRIQSKIPNSNLIIQFPNLDSENKINVENIKLVKTINNSTGTIDDKCIPLIKYIGVNNEKYIKGELSNGGNATPDNIKNLITRGLVAISDVLDAGYIPQMDEPVCTKVTASDIQIGANDTPPIISYPNSTYNEPEYSCIDCDASKKIVGIGANNKFGKDFGGLNSTVIQEFIDAGELALKSGAKGQKLNIRWTTSYEDKPKDKYRVKEAEDHFKSPIGDYDVALWVHWSKLDGTEKLLVDSRINPNKFSSSQAADMKKNLESGIKWTLAGKRSNLYADRNIEPPKEGGTLGDVSSSNNDPWKFGVRQTGKSNVEYFAEVLKLSKEFLFNGEISERLWKYNGDCLFDAPGGLIGPVNGAVDVVGGTVLDVAGLLNLIDMMIGDPSVAKEVGKSLVAPQLMLLQQYKDEITATFNDPDEETRWYFGGKLIVSTIGKALTGTLATSLIPDPKKITKNITTLTSTFHNKPDFNSAINQLGNEGVNRKSSAFTEKLGKIGEGSWDHPRIKKIANCPFFVTFWKKVEDDDEITKAKLQKFSDNFNLDNEAVKSNFEKAFKDADPVVCKEFLNDISNNKTFANHINANPTHIIAYKILVDGGSANKMDIPTLDKLSNDIVQNAALEAAFNANNKNIKAWELMIDTDTKKRHIPTLEKVAGMMNDASFMSKLSGGESTLKEILKNAANPLENGTNSKLVPLPVHLDNIKTVVINHSSVDGFSQVISDLKHPLFAKQDGVSHAVNDLKNIPAGTISKLDMEFEEPGKPCVKCTFDVKENGTPPKFREYKSYSDASQIPLPQFLNYLNEINSLDNLKYIFNAKKLTTEQAKDGMKEFFVKNYDTIWTAGQPKGFFDGLKLKNGTVVDDKLLFKEYLSEIKSSNSLFDFVDSI